jgi:hypothetical protein
MKEIRHIWLYLYHWIHLFILHWSIGWSTTTRKNQCFVLRIFTNFMRFNHIHLMEKKNTTYLKKYITNWCSKWNEFSSNLDLKFPFSLLGQYFIWEKDRYWISLGLCHRCYCCVSLLYLQTLVVFTKCWYWDGGSPTFLGVQLCTFQELSC